MSLLLFKILVICTSLLAWVVLSFAGISLLQYTRYNKKITLIAFITLILCVVSFYNSLYEGLFLFKKIALFPSLNSWAFTLLTPLFYLYFRFRITNRLPDAQQWRRHILLPGILAAIYLLMTLFSPVSDKLIYSWNEFRLNSSAWWGYFRISCYLLLIAQLLVYLPRISDGIDNKYTSRVQHIKKELSYILCFYTISIVSMFTPSYICNILYNLSVIFLGGYLLKQSVFYRTINRKIGFYLLPFSIKTETKQRNEIETPILFNPEEGGALICLLNSPAVLHNPDLTLKMLARELGTNATSLSNYFNQQLGICFSEYVITRRLDEAEVMLKNTDITAIEISELVGFQTTSTFYQAFNMRHHMPPSQWRKKIKLDR